MSMSWPNADQPGSSDHDAQAAVGVCPFAPPQYFRPPRLSIIHLLAWTAATAVMLKFYVASKDVTGAADLSGAAEAFYQALQFAGSAAFGAAVVGTTVLLLGKVCRDAGRLQPGHWFLLIETVTAIVRWMLLAARLALKQTGTAWSDESFFTWYLSLWGATGLVIASAYFFVARRVWDDRPWKVPAVTAAIVYLILGILRLAGLLSSIALSAAFWPAWSLIVGVTSFVALLRDLGRGARRDWVHWLGVALMSITNVLPVVAWVVFRLFLGMS